MFAELTLLCVVSKVMRARPKKLPMKTKVLFGR